MRRRPLPATVAIVAAAAALAACTSSAHSATSPTTIGTATAPAAATTTTAPPACQLASGYGPGNSTHHLTVAGEDRVFRLHVPPHPTAGMRLVVDFHGASSNAIQQEVYSGFDPVADRNRFVVATPNGVDAAVRQWRFLGKPNDIPFSVALVRDVAHNACVDPAHAYAVGISSGGAMTASLACQASDTFAGFGPVAADFYLAPICDHARRRPIIIFHGTADPVVPYGGGSVGGGPTPVQPAETSAALWAHHDGCTSGPTKTRLGSQVVRLTWKGCATPVVMYRIEGGGHTWPGSAIKVPGLGLTTEQISATAEMWKFFAAN